MDTDIAITSSLQDGLVTRSQIDAAGITAAQRRRFVESGWLEPVGRTVYAVAGTPRTLRFKLRAGLLVLGDNAQLGFESAAALLGLDRSDGTAVEFLSPRDVRNRKVPFGVVHTTAALGPTDVIVVDGFRTTSATRTILDLALARKPTVRIEAAIDSAIRLGLSSPRVISLRLETLRGPGRWGCRLVDVLIDSGGVHSHLERRFLELIVRAGLPAPETQMTHHRDGVFVARVDFEWPALKVIVEVDGQLGHADRAGRARDAQRRNELQDLGYRVYHFTYEQVTRRGPWVAQQMRNHLAHAASAQNRSA